MNTSNQMLMQQARESLKGKWGIAVLASVVIVIVSSVGGVLPGIGILISLGISGPLALGVTMFWLTLARGETVEITTVFAGFKYFLNALLTFLWLMLFVMLWLLLLIVPGIVAGYSYAMTFYILADNPNLDPREAITQSKAMMQGNKWKLACLSFRFFGWSLLAVLTLGIGFLWLVPYIQVSIAKFYEDIKGATR